MIVKVQLPLSSSEGNAPALIYSEGRENRMFVSPDELPRDVVRAVQAGGGKAYFHLKIEGGELIFGVQAAPQPW